VAFSTKHRKVSSGGEIVRADTAVLELQATTELRGQLRGQLHEYCGGIEWVCRRGARSSGSTGRSVYALEELSG
jgi:hypothetical protein